MKSAPFVLAAVAAALAGCGSGDAPITGGNTPSAQNAVQNDPNVPPEAKARAAEAMNQAQAQGEAMKKAAGR